MTNIKSTDMNANANVAPNSAYFAKALQSGATETLVSINRYQARTDDTKGAFDKAVKLFEDTKDPAALTLARQLYSEMPAGADKKAALHTLSDKKA